MSCVLSIIHPPVAPAKYGKATVSVPAPSHAFVVEWAVAPLVKAGVPYSEATLFAAEIWRGAEHPESVTVHEPTGIAFQIHDAVNAPHPCPCCGRLVEVGDHADAHMEDAYCTGCFTWNRDDNQCLPTNTAHTEEP